MRLKVTVVGFGKGHQYDFFPSMSSKLFYPQRLVGNACLPYICGIGNGVMVSLFPHQSLINATIGIRLWQQKNASHSSQNRSAKQKVHDFPLHLSIQRDRDLMTTLCVDL